MGCTDVPSAVDLADGGRDGDAHILEKDFVELRRAGHLTERADLDSGLVHLEQQVADASVFGRFGVRAHEGEDHLGGHRARGPDLLAVDDEVVAVSDATRLDRGEVRAGAGLGVALTPLDFASNHWRQELRLLLLGAVHEDRGADVVDALDRRAHLGEDLAKDELFDRREVGPAVLLGPCRCDPAAVEDRFAPGLHQLFAALLGEVASMEAAERAGVELVVGEFLRQVLLDERGHLGAPGCLFCRVVEVDHRRASGRSVRVCCLGWAHCRRRGPPLRIYCRACLDRLMAYASWSSHT